jgi:hypothetical protein
MTSIIQRDVRAAVIGVRRDGIIESVPLVVAALDLPLMQGD